MSEERKLFKVTLLLLLVVLASGCIGGSQEEETAPAQSVAIVVDAETHSMTEEKVNRLADDIKNDLNLKEVNVYARSWSSAQEVRDVLKQDYENKALRGALLIGKVPYVVMETEHYAEKVDDVYYKDLDHQFKDTDSDNKFNNPPEGEREDEIWVGRILPPSGKEHVALESPNGYKPQLDSEAVSELEEYLDRNHDYRTKKDHSQNILFFAPSAPESVDSLTYLEDANPKERFRRWSLETITRTATWVEGGIIERGSPKKMSKEYLQKVQTPYEFVYVNAHGSDNYHQDVNPEDIERVEPQGLFYKFDSCSVGDFSSPDYLAGHYLFDGRGLTAVAPTIPIFVATGRGDPVWKDAKRLRDGSIFGEIRSNTPNILGDPTLKMRYQSFDDWEYFPPEPQGVTSNPWYHEKDDVLEFSWLEGKPPDEIQSGGKVDVGFKLTNNGDRPIDEITVSRCCGISETLNTKTITTPLSPSKSREVVFEDVNIPDSRFRIPMQAEITYRVGVTLHKLSPDATEKDVEVVES